MEGARRNAMRADSREDERGGRGSDVCVEFANVGGGVAAALPGYGNPQNWRVCLGAAGK